MLNRQMIALIVSETFLSFMPEAESWSQLFVRRFCSLLGHSRIMAPKTTVDFLKFMQKEFNREHRSTVAFEIERYCSEDHFNVDLAAAIAKNAVKQAVVIQNPRDPELKQSRYSLLLPTAVLYDCGLYTDLAAHEWADYGVNQRPPRIEADETLVLISNGDERRIARFVENHVGALRAFPRILADQETKKVVSECLSANPSIPRLQIECIHTCQGFSGAGLMIASEVLQRFRGPRQGRVDRLSRPLYHIICFGTNEHISTANPDFDALLSVAANPCLRVNLMIGHKMAHEWATRYQLPNLYLQGVA